MRIQKKYISILVTSLLLSACVSEKDDETGTTDPVNNPPVVKIENKSLNVDEGKSVSTMVTITDVDGDSLSNTVKVSPENMGTATLLGSTLTYQAPSNVSKDETVNITIESNDGKVKVSDKIVVKVINVSNEKPVLSLSSTEISMNDSSSLVGENAVMITVDDPDGDVLSLSLDNSSFSSNNVDVTYSLKKIDDKNYALEITTGKLNIPSVTLKGKVILTDSQISVDKDINLTISKVDTEVTPVINAPDVVEIKEGENNVISYTISDPDTPVESLVVSFEVLNAFEHTSSIDQNKKQIVINNVNVDEEMQSKLLLKVTDGTFTSTKEVILNVKNNIDTAMNDFIKAYNPVKSKYAFISSRNDEKVLLSFYKETAKLVKPDSLALFDGYELEIQNSTTLEKDAVKTYIDELDTFIATSNQTTEKFSEMYVKLAELQNKVDGFGALSLDVLNNKANATISNLLPKLDKADKISSFEINGVTYYSRYVGNTKYGSFDQTKTKWTFTDQFRYMEFVNFLSTECSI